MTGTTDPVSERHWACACRLRERRHQLGLTQAEVVARAGRSGAPLSNRNLSAMEHGRGLDLGRLPDLAAALDCTITYLVGLTADPARWEPDTPLGGRGRGGPPRTARHHWILGPEPPAGTGPHRATDGREPPPQK